MTGRSLAICLTSFLCLAPLPVSAQTEQVEYYGLDAVGSVRVVFNSTGTVVGRMDYAPFGEELFNGLSVPTDRFAELKRDGEAGLDYAQARMYLPRAGRLTATDPVDGDPKNPQSWNKYIYAVNNPLSFRDPSGLLAETGIQSSFCGAEYSYGSCGGAEMFWKLGFSGGLEFGSGYARAVEQGYTPGMPAEVWTGLDEFNQDVNQTILSAYLERAESYTVDGTVAQIQIAAARALQLSRDAVRVLTPQAIRGLDSLVRLLGVSPQSGIRNGYLTVERIAHIVEGHFPGGANLHGGVFSSGTSLNQLSNMVNTTLQNGAIIGNTMGRPGHIFTYNLGYTIGVNSQGVATSTLRLVRAPNGVILTAFPH